ncbi:MAG TPA: hypothetical protein VLE93_00435 [Candidatus Saccharimonadales bacterium]|nr:hypothetical protein [Candidatus Saccharimonadales bacterium]
MLIYVTGSDAYLAKQAIDQLKAKYLAKNDGAELIEINADETLPNFADLQAVPLFATSRLAIIKKVGVLDGATQDSLASVLGSLPPTTVAAVWDQKPLAAKSALATTLSGAAKKIVAEALDEPATRRWIRARSQELGLQLDEAVVSSLLSAGGNDLWFLETELRFLATTAGGKNDDRPRQTARPDDYFVYYRLVRQKAWAKIGRQLAADFQGGTPFELLLGSLAAAVRKEAVDQPENRPVVELLGDVDFGTKTGLLEPGAAIALLAHRLSNPAGNRVHWEAMWEGLV